MHLVPDAMKFHNAVFEVTETSACPLYKVGGEFIMQDSMLTMEDDRQVCLILMRELLKVLAHTTPNRQTCIRQAHIQTDRHASDKHTSKQTDMH
ncbi:MAG: hypothetical protein D3906_11570, partial [Candidatus Electrothrix sp. AUS1_2]|nr:hypothetical protein [Candidatus Electrothrix sp. AUS1_2]